LQSQPLFAKNGFAVENRELIGEAQEPRELQKQLRAGSNRVALDQPQGVVAVSDFHLLAYIASLDVLSKVRSSFPSSLSTHRNKTKTNPHRTSSHSSVASQPPKTPRSARSSCTRQVGPLLKPSCRCRRTYKRDITGFADFCVLLNSRLVIAAYDCGSAERASG
jgi:hypothetical protein